jgi:flavin-dependent dehydrogenase
VRTDASDVTVVGASAAGLFVAARLAAEGARVRVLERAATLPPPARTLIATHRVRGLLGPVGDGSIVNEIRTFELFADGVVASVGLHRPDVIVERSALVCGLADQAQVSGADIRLGRSFIRAEASSDGMSVVSQDSRTKREEAIPSQTLVGADGAMSRVARDGGWPQQTTVPLVQALVQCPTGLPSDTVRVWFRPHETPYFYWLIPEGDGRGVVGLIGERRHAVRSHLDGFLRERNLAPIAYQAARIPLYQRWRPVRKRVRSGAVYLVGDAAGHVKSTTVGGLVTGFRGAEAVAETILGRRTSLFRSLRVELDLHVMVRRILQRFGESEYKRLLGLIRPAEHRLLSGYTRDETSRLLWRLCAREPRFALLALRGLMGGRSEGLGEVSVERVEPAGRASQSSALT